MKSVDFCPKNNFVFFFLVRKWKLDTKLTIGKFAFVYVSANFFQLTKKYLWKSEYFKIIDSKNSWWTKGNPICNKYYYQKSWYCLYKSPNSLIKKFNDNYLKCMFFFQIFCLLCLL